MVDGWKNWIDNDGRTEMDRWMDWRITGDLKSILLRFRRDVVLTSGSSLCACWILRRRVTPYVKELLHVLSNQCLLPVLNTTAGVLLETILWLCATLSLVVSMILRPTPQQWRWEEDLEKRQQPVVLWENSALDCVREQRDWYSSSTSLNKQSTYPPLAMYIL